VAYKNPDGKIVLVVQNSSPDSQQVAINLDGRKIKPILPAHSVSTFVTDWSVYSKAFYKIQAENYSDQYGVVLERCNDARGEENFDISCNK
jgi:hypothetical protein